MSEYAGLLNPKGPDFKVECLEKIRNQHHLKALRETDEWKEICLTHVN